MTLAIEPSLIFDQTDNALDQQYADRLREYVNLDLLSIVFVSKDDEPDEIVSKMRQYGFRCSPRIFNPVSNNISIWRDKQWAIEQDSTNPSKVVLVVSSALQASVSKSLPKPGM